jgi:cation diffusion facilitator CzcD-associated flavoprotein CzcO
VLETPRGAFGADFVIAATGVRMDPALVPMLRHCAYNIALWADRYTPPPEEADARLAAFPYLSPESSFIEKRAGETPWIADIHLFGIGTTMSFGPAGSSINAMSIAAPRLAAGVTKGLFAADLPRLLADLRAYAVPQVELDRSKLAAQ